MCPGFARLEVQGTGNGEKTLTGLVGSLMMSSPIFEPVRFAGFAVSVQQARLWRDAQSHCLALPWEWKGRRLCHDLFIVRRQRVHTLILRVLPPSTMVACCMLTLNWRLVCRIEWLTL